MSRFCWSNLNPYSSSLLYVQFVSCGDDATVRIWDWAGRREERVLEGHGWDVKVRELVN
jgi:WD40 repeat protein